MPDAAVPDAAVRSFTDDTAADFGSGTLASATVEPWGAVAPVAYYTGGLHHRASDDGYFTDGVTATWEEVQGFTRTDRRDLAWNASNYRAVGTPTSVGLTDGDSWTQWWEGEIWLEQGSWTFQLWVDDHGFVDIAEPGTTEFVRLLSANLGDEEVGAAFEAAVTAWYPIRLALADETGDAIIQLLFSGPGVPYQAIPRDRFRARVDGLVGLEEVAFQNSYGLGIVATTLDQIAPANVTWGGGAPADLGVGPDYFSIRWTGQLRIDIEGDYVFDYEADDMQRLWIDGVQVIDNWEPDPYGILTSPIPLAPGWHDLVIDHSEVYGDAHAVLGVYSGPDLVGEGIPLDRLRPVEARAERISTGSIQSAGSSIPDGGSLRRSLWISAPSAATLKSIDVHFVVEHPDWSELKVILHAPDGTQVILWDHAAGGSEDNPWLGPVVTLTGAVAGSPVNGYWDLAITDDAGSHTGKWHRFQITPHWAGGEPPIPATSSYESTVRDLGADPVASIAAVTWAERLPPGTDVAVRVRTCDRPADCAAEAWSDPVTEPGGTPAATPARYLQYRIELTSDGDHAPSVEWLQVDY